MKRPSRATLLNGSITAVAAVIVVALLLFQTGLLPIAAGTHDEQELTVTDCDGAVKTTVTADVASSFSQQYVGLSRTSSLQDDRGMLFPAGNEGNITIEMRNMNYDLDVVYISADGRITSIKHGDAPSGPLQYYLTYDTVTGNGQYVLEMNDGWAAANNVSNSDCVRGLNRAR